jgi:hypothetical protein
MAAPGEKSSCVLEYHTSKSGVTVQRAFRAKYAKDPPTDKTTRAWYKQFTETGCLCKQKSSGSPLTAEDDVERVRASFLHSPKKSTATAAKELSMSKTTAWRVLHKRLVFKPYHIQMVQKLSDEDHRRRLDFCLRLQDLMSSDNHFLEKVQFSDEATFHVSGAVNRRSVRIWGSETPHAYVEHQRDSPKVKVFCAISSQKVYGPFFFAEETVTGTTYLDMLQNIPSFTFQQDGSPAHLHCEDRQYLNTVLPGRWIGRASGNDQPLLLWPPMSPDTTPCDIFLWGCVKDRVFVPPLPRDLADLKARFIAALKNIDAPMLTRVWQELECRIDVCRVTRGSQIEHL